MVKNDLITFGLYKWRVLAIDERLVRISEQSFSSYRSICLYLPCSLGAKRSLPLPDCLAILC